MKISKQEYRQFLKDNFEELNLQKPLFYNWNKAIRFDSQIVSVTEEYFHEVVKRASTIFQSVFESSDEMFLIFADYKHKRRKIRFSNYVFKQVKNLKKEDVCYTKEKKVYFSGVMNIGIIKTTIDNINYKNILTAIANTNFQSREPRLDKESFFTSKEVYFINIDKKLIFNMYDDRGFDIIATDKETIRPIYEKYNNWILDYDREKIDKLFA